MTECGGMMFRRLFAAILAAGLLLLIGAPAYAAPPVTTTNTEKNLVETVVDVVPSCEGTALYRHHNQQPGRSNHMNDHFNVRPDSTVNEFFHCHD
jgi:predicted lipoprotein with Yx(FWY)xxD motif